MLATLYANDESLFEEAEKAYVQALTIGTEASTIGETILGFVE